MEKQIQDASQTTTAIRFESVRSILQRKGHEVWSLPPDATVFDAISMMDARQVGALLVVEEGQLIGIVSERDYARKVILKGRSSKGTLVRDIMTSPLTTVTPDHAVDECLREITTHRVRHLPVLERGELVGVVSIGDLVHSIITAQADAIDQLTSYIAGKYPG